MEGVKERQKEMEGGSGGDDDHLHHPYSLLHCLLRAFHGCFGLLDSDPLFPNHSSSQTHPHDTPPPVQEDDAFITTTEEVTLIQSLGVRMPRKPPANPGRGGQTN